MSNSQAAYNKKVYVSSDNTNWFKLPATSPSLEIQGEVLDDTDLATNAGFRTRCLGLNDWNVSADSNFKPITGTQATDDASGATALKMCIDSKLNRTTLYAKYLPTGAEDGTGFKGEVVVENVGFSGGVEGLETSALTLQGNGALASAT